MRFKVYHQYAILDCTRRGPVEHASAVVLHLSLLKVKVLRLVVSDPNLEFLWLLTSIFRLVGRPGNVQMLDPLDVQRVNKAQGLLTIHMHIEYGGERGGDGFIKLLANLVKSEKNIEHL